jgi:hypothetical protein
MKKSKMKKKTLTTEHERDKRKKDYCKPREQVLV